MSNSKKPLAVLSMAAVAGLLATAITTPVSAAASAIAVTGNDAKTYEYNYADLKTSAVAAVTNDTTGAKLYNDFMNRKKSIKAYYDDVQKSYVDFSVVSAAVSDFVVNNPGKTFDFAGFLKTATTEALTTVKTTVGTDGYIALDGVSTKPADNPTPTGALSVSSVSAINAKEIKVTFNQPVDEDSALALSNYVISVNDVKYYVGATPSATEQPLTSLLVNVGGNFTTGTSFNAAENSVTFRLKDAFTTNGGTANVLANGAKYSVDVKDGVLTYDKSTKATKYTDTQKTFSDTVAPKLVKSEITSANKLKLTFDEPVSAANLNTTSGLSATVDGVAITLAAPSTAIKTYTVESAAVLPDAQKTVGTHTVSAYNATDLAAPNANGVTILTGSFSVTADTTAPTVQKIVPVKNNDRAFDIVFTEPLKSFDATKLVVKKGNYTFADNTAFAAAAIAGSTTYKVEYTVLETDGTVDTTSLGAFSTGVSQVVRVTFGADATTPINALYATSEASTALSVEVDNYKDTADLVGAKYDGSVTVTKDQVGPKVASQYDNSITGTVDNTTSTSVDGLLVAKFDKALSTTGTDTDVTKITVTDKDGIPRTVTTATVAGTGNQEVRLALTGLTDRDDMEAKAPFTVNFAAGAVKATNNVLNSALTTTVLPSNSIAAPVAEAVASPVVVGSGNVITVTYTPEMTASAANLANYTLDTVAFPTGTTISMNGTNRVVTITLPEGYTNANITKLLTISKNVMTKSGSAVVGSVATKAPYTQTLAFTDNTKPTITDAKYEVTNVDTDVQTSIIKVTFSEKLGAVSQNDAPTMKDFKVVINGATQTISGIAASGDKAVTLTLANPVNVAQAATISIVPVGTDNPSMEIKDAATPANTAKEGSTTITSGKELNTAALTADATAVATDKAALTLTTTGGEALTAVKSALTLGTASNGSTINWASNNAQISNTGAVIRPAYNPVTSANVSGTFVATITKGSSTDTKTFNTTVLALKPAATGTVAGGTADFATGVALNTLNITINNDASVPTPIAGLNLATTGLTLGTPTNLSGSLLGKTVSLASGNLTIAGLTTGNAGTFDLPVTDGAGNSFALTVSVTQQ